MSLLTPELRARLLVQGAEAAQDLPPLVKLYHPMSSATWLASGLAADGDTLSGIADWGLGCPEPCCFSLRALETLRLPWGFAIAREQGFASSLPLPVWTWWSRKAGSILFAEALLARACMHLSRFPPPP